MKLSVQNNVGCEVPSRHSHHLKSSFIIEFMINSVRKSTIEIKNSAAATRVFFKGENDDELSQKQFLIFDEDTPENTRSLLS